MTRTTWRGLAGLLALSLGGIVVCANDKVAKPEPAAKSGPQCPAACPTQCPAPCPCPDSLPCATPAPVVMQPAPDSPVVPAVAPRAEEPCVVPGCPVVAVAEAPPAPPPAPAVRPVAFTTAVQTVAAMPYKVRMEMVSGMTQVELVRGDDVALRVQCDRVDVQMPGGGLHAIGKVCVSAPGLEVRCNRVMIGWQAGDITMEGQVRILCQNGPMRTEMTAETVNCRLSGVGGVEFTTPPAAHP